MGKNRTRAVALGLCLCLAALCLCPAALAMSLGGSRPPQGGSQGSGPAGVYRVSLDAQTIGAGRSLAFETVAAELAGNPFVGDYYPGSLRVELAGPIVIEKGGFLSIGTLSVGNPKEQSPVLRGELCPQGLITVKAGGTLVLKTATLELTGQGLFLVQEPGGSVELVDTAVADGLVQWAPPTVDNTYRAPADLWLEEGTALTQDLLPRTMKVPVQDRGEAEQRELALSWDLADYDGRTRGEWTATGEFLDEDGAVLPSVRPLTLRVRWVAPERLVITNTAWLGSAAATAKLELRELPAEAEQTWGEVSQDGGKRWERWEPFELRRGDGGISAIFSLPDATPRYFRLCAASADGSKRWSSERYRLPKGSTVSTDQGGNRGGATAVARPSRTPASPAPEPTVEPTPTVTPTVEPTSTPTAAPSVAPAPTETPTATPTAEPPVGPVPTPETTPIPTAEPTIEPTPAPVVVPAATPTAAATPVPTEAANPTPSAEPTADPTPSAAPSTPSTATSTPEPAPAPAPHHLPAAVQALLVVGGLGVCVSLGVLFTRKRK